MQEKEFVKQLFVRLEPQILRYPVESRLEIERALHNQK